MNETFWYTVFWFDLDNNSVRGHGTKPTTNRPVAGDWAKHAVECDAAKEMNLAAFLVEKPTSDPLNLESPEDLEAIQKGSQGTVFTKSGTCILRNGGWL